MKYKQQVTDRTDSAIQKLEIAIRGMESNTLTANEVKEQMESAKRILISVNELVELE